MTPSQLSRCTLFGLALTVGAGGRAIAAQEVVELHVSPEVLALAVGQRQRLFFSAFDARGNIAEQPVYRLGTSNASVAKVEPDGTVVGVAPGIALLVVTAGRGSATVKVLVGEEAVSGATVSDTLTQASDANDALSSASVRQVVVSPPPSPDPVELSVGESRRFSVRPLGVDSTLVAVARWSLTDSVVARFDGLSGNLQAVNPGMTELVAAVPGVAELKWRIEVTPLSLALSPSSMTIGVGDSRSVEAAYYKSQGEAFKPLSGGTWSTSDPAILTVDSKGTIRGVGLGRATLTARGAGGDSATARVTVVGELLFSARGPVTSGAGLYQAILSGTATVQQLLVDGATNLYAVRSPDRATIAFSSDASGRYHVYRMDSETGEIERLTDAPGHQTQPVWTPDGHGIVFTSTRTGTPQIFEMAPDGSNVIQLTHGDNANHSPALSPDGASLAVVRGTGNDERVFLLDRDGSNVRPVRLAEADQTVRTPRFFPDGDLAAVVGIGTRATAIVRWDRQRDLRIPLVTSDNAIRDFAVSRDGRLLLLVIESTERHHEFPVEVLLVNLDTRESTTVTVPLAPGERVANPSF